MALWILSTPIGTLSDLSDRAKHTLNTADVIAAEDTRVTRKLLAAVGVAAPEIVALHAHNEEGKAEAWAERAAEQQVVLVSDAGTPGVSDPGRFVVAAC
ncbi:MAG: SAM-dependent methyltransferase, partial [Myxococcota bacterium]